MLKLSPYYLQKPFFLLHIQRIQCHVVKDVGKCGKKQRTQYDGNDDLDTIGNVEIAALIAKSVVDTGFHG